MLTENYRRQAFIGCGCDGNGTVMVACVQRLVEYSLLNVLYFRYLGSKTKQKRFFSSAPKKSPVDEARDLLATVVLAHVPVSCYVVCCLKK
jgi:hypothetical protein